MKRKAQIFAVELRDQLRLDAVLRAGLYLLPT
jgi:hypothetical protein